MASGFLRLGDRMAAGQKVSLRSEERCVVDVRGMKDIFELVGKEIDN